MTAEDIQVIGYKKFDTKNFSFWVSFIDRRKNIDTLGRKGRKSFITYLESTFGKLGNRWHYQKDNLKYIIKFDKESDLLIFLMKFKTR
jgi:hypothetical protein